LLTQRDNNSTKGSGQGACPSSPQVIAGVIGPIDQGSDALQHFRFGVARGREGGKGASFDRAS